VIAHPEMGDKIMGAKLFMSFQNYMTFFILINTKYVLNVNIKLDI